MSGNALNWINQPGLRTSDSAPPLMTGFHPPNASPCTRILGCTASANEGAELASPLHHYSKHCSISLHQRGVIICSSSMGEQTFLMVLVPYLKATTSTVDFLTLSK